MELVASDISSKYFLNTSGDEAARTAGYRGLGTVFNDKAMTAFSNWISVYVLEANLGGGRTLSIQRANNRDRFSC